MADGGNHLRTVLPSSTARILELLQPDDRVLDVGGWAAPFNRATHVLDLMPYETRGAMGSYGPERAWFSADTWVQRDVCDRAPWPWPADFFDFALCVTTLEDVRDPVGVCSELSRVARRGYVEVPTIVHELTYAVDGRGRHLGFDHHRWLCFVSDDGIEFMHKPHSIHDVWQVRVLPRWAARLELEDLLQGLFWDGELRATERHVIPGPYLWDELEAEVRAVCRPSEREWQIRRLWHRARHGLALAARPLRRIAERAISR